MPSFAEVQTRLTTLKYRRAILAELADFLETKFLPVSGSQAEMTLMTEERIKVPEESLEKEVQNLLSEMQTLEDAMKDLLQASVDVK